MWALATLQVFTDDTLVTQSYFTFNITALGKNLNRGVFMAAAGTVYYPGWLIPYGWDRQLAITAADISGALSGKVYMQVGLVDASSRPGRDNA